jgi:hypothetical protein
VHGSEEIVRRALDRGATRNLETGTSELANYKQVNHHIVDIRKQGVFEFFIIHETAEAKLTATHR